MPPYDSLNLGGGVGDEHAAVTTNRRRFAADAGLPATALMWMRQVHGTRLVTVGSAGLDRSASDQSASDQNASAQGASDQGEPGLGTAVPDCDGLVSAVVGVGLAVLVADCVPILLADPVTGVIGAVHAGRRGAADGIALRALEAMSAAGATQSAVQVLLGPAICGDCYEVPAAMRDDVDQHLPGSASVTGRGTPGLDLRAGLAGQLRAAGVDSVVVDTRCTYTDLELFSHRRGAPTGRLAGLIWMTN